MRSLKEIQTTLAPHNTRGLFRPSEVEALSAELETNGIVVLPSLLNSEQLAGMQKAFETRLRRIRWNNFAGYQKTERFRHMIEDVLLLDQGFLDLALHPRVKQILNRYLGVDYELTEAKGWKSLPTKCDFHGWHGDAWYDQTTETKIHREIKLGFYLTDVRSGAFNFIKGSHRRQHPRELKRQEANDLDLSQLVELTGPAGRAFMFDTSAIHRQGLPMLESRQAVFFSYHDPSVPLQREDVITYRYHPLLLNAAVLGGVCSQDQRILGFGNKTNYQPAFERKDQTPLTYNAFSAIFGGQLHARELCARIAARLRRALDR